MEKILESSYCVRFNDCDPFSHLNNSRYIDYFLNAREDHLKTYYQLDLADFAKKGIGWVVTAHEIQYLRPAMYNETICIQSALIELGPSNLVVEMIMLDAAKTTIKSILWSKLTCINLKTGKRSDHPEDFMEFAKGVLVSEIQFEEGLKVRVNDLLRR
jgi:acyl-CoA thioester hydrolase